MENKLKFQKIIHLKVINSTNLWAWDVYKLEKPFENLVFLADYQTQGQGMSGQKWEARKGENLTFSLLIPQTLTEATDFFWIDQWVLITLYDTLFFFGIKNVKIKWPNDLYIQTKKVAGILIEHRWRGRKTQATVIGIGLNVHQKTWNFLEATSLAHWTDQILDRQEILTFFLQKMEENFPNTLEKKQNLHQQYLNYLWFYQNYQNYQISEDQSVKTLKIIDVLSNGELVAVDKNNQKYHYKYKELKPLFE